MGSSVIWEVLQGSVIVCSGRMIQSHPYTYMYAAMHWEVVLRSSIQVASGGLSVILDSIVVSIPACHAGDQGSIPCRGDVSFRVAQRYTNTVVPSTGRPVAGAAQPTRAPMLTHSSVPLLSTHRLQVLGFVGLLEEHQTVQKTCIGRESNPGRPRGRRAFYH